MKEGKPNNSVASIRQRLLNLSRKTGEPFQFVLTRYAIERLLFRLSQSEHADKFLLKGAILFTVWTGAMHRPTRDLDLLGSGDSEAEALLEVFRQVCELSADDGLSFPGESMAIDKIREDQEYEGQRITMIAKLGNARVNLQIDVGFGDSVTPGPESINFPTLLGTPAPTLKAYPKETVVSEKFQAMVSLGLANSRMKDFYDIWVLCREFPFKGKTLIKAIQRTFKRRGTELPAELPIALAEEFGRDHQKQVQWKAFLRKSSLDSGPIDLVEVVRVLCEFLWPPATAAKEGKPFDRDWKGGQWQ